MPQQLMIETLREWRDAERLLLELPPVSRDHETVRHVVIELRSLYVRLAELTEATPEVRAESQKTLNAARRKLLKIHEHLGH